MRRIATIDRQPRSDKIAVWVTSRSTPLQAGHTNAVVIDMANDPDATKKIRSLTRCCVVLITDATVVDGLPIEGDPLTVADVGDLVTLAEDTQRDILDALAGYEQRTRSRSLVEPTFPLSPARDAFRPEADSPSARALATANYLARGWTAWLRTDDERRRRTVHPRTGESPWIMPKEMSAPTVADFPAGFTSRLHEQALL